MLNNRITSHPPVKKSAKDFILDAENRGLSHEPRERVNDIKYPWNEDRVRQDVQKVFTVKLTEEYILKIKYISERTNKSQQKIVREIITSNIDKILKEIDQ